MSNGGGGHSYTEGMEDFEGANEGVNKNKQRELLVEIMNDRYEKMKYIVVYIQGAIVAGSFDQPLPGTMIEVDRYSTLEMAQNEAKSFRAKYGGGGSVVILPYYEVED